MNCINYIIQYEKVLNSIIIFVLLLFIFVSYICIKKVNDVVIFCLKINFMYVNLWLNVFMGIYNYICKNRKLKFVL